MKIPARFTLLLAIFTLLTACAPQAAATLPAVETADPIVTPSAVPTLTPTENGNAAQLAALQPQLPEGITVANIKDLGQGLSEAYDPNGNLLFIKESADSDWQLTPGGFRVDPVGTFLDQWNPETRKWEPKYTDIDLTPALEIMKPTFTAAKSGELGCLGDRWCLDVEVIPGQEQAAYQYAVDSMAKAVTLREYWQGFGITDLSAKGLLDYFSTQVGGPENRPYWVSAVNPQGIPIKFLQGVGNAFSVNMQPYQAMANYGGFYLDRMTYTAYSVDQWQQDIWTKLLFTYLETNKISSSQTLVINQNLGDGKAIEFGAILNPIDGGLLFLAGVRAHFPPAWASVFELDTKSDPSKLSNSIKIQTDWNLFWEVSTKWQQQKDYRWQNVQLTWVPGNLNRHYFIDIEQVKPQFFQVKAH